MRSSEIAKLAGVSVRTLRHYHAIGLMAEPPRSANGYRDYSPADLLRLLRIRQMASLGFPLERVGAMLDAPCSADDASDDADAQLSELDDALAAQIARLQERRAVISRIRRSRLGADVPERAAAALGAARDLMELLGPPASPRGELSENERLGLEISLHVYSDAELAEIERIARAIPERGLTAECREADRMVEALSSSSSPSEVARAAMACRALIDKLVDCFTPGNWLRDDHDYEVLLYDLAAKDCNAVQKALMDELMRYIERKVRARRA